MKQLVPNLSVKMKILILTAMLLITSMILMAGIAYRMIIQYEENILMQRAEEIADLHVSYIPKEIEGILQRDPDELTERDFNILKGYLSEVIDHEAPVLLNAFLLGYSKEEGSYKHLVSSRANSLPSLSRQETREGLHELSKNGRSASFLYDSSDNESAVGLKKVSIGDGSSYILGIKINMEDVQVNDWNVAKTFIIAMVFIILIWIFIIRAFLNRLLEPINVLVEGVKKLSDGNFHVKLTKPKEPDFQPLFDQFNYMVKQLQMLFAKLVETSSRIGKATDEELPISTFDDAIKEMDNIVYNAYIQKELQKAEKMNAIGQLAASVAHEIRNPMTVVKGFLQILEDRQSIGNQEKAYIKLMMDELNRAEGIINDYLSMTKTDFESKEELLLSDFVMHIVDLMNGYALMVGNIQLHYHLDFDRPIHIYKNEVKQVLINVIKNGMEAMKEGGELSFTVTLEEPYIVFSIEDTGTGMTREQVERLGTAFYSLKDKGTGMGLMVCYQIMEKMGGRIEVDSQKGVGSIFKVYVPHT
ncbi:ATP-binding protein [Gracilibacillus sp. Marseille-QA3620]